MTYKRKQLFSRSSFSSLAMIISDMYNFGVGRYYDALTFSSIIFVNCILHIYVVLDPPLRSVYIQPCREMIVIKLTKVERAEA